MGAAAASRRRLGVGATGDEGLSLSPSLSLSLSGEYRFRSEDRSVERVAGGRVVQSLCALVRVGCISSTSSCGLSPPYTLHLTCHVVCSRRTFQSCDLAALPLCVL